MSSASSQNIFSSSEGSDSIEYQPVSLAATLSCVLGLGSLLALTGRLFWVIPLAGVLMAVFALCRISRSVEPLLGRNRAVVGLLLSTFLGSWAVAADFVWQNELKVEAEEKAIQWLQLVRGGNMAKAYQLTLRYERREPVATVDLNADAGGPPTPPSVRLNEFKNKEVVKLIHGDGGPAQFRLEKMFGTYHEEGADVVGLRMCVESVQDGRTQLRSVYMEMLRNVEPKAKSAYWHVNKIEPYKDHAP